MKRMLSGVLAVCVYTAAAQFSTPYEKAADAYFAQGDYFSAAQYYEKYITGSEKGVGNNYDPYSIHTLHIPAAISSGKKQAVYRLAECYRLLHYPARAEKWYLFVTEHYKEAFPQARYYYAVSQRELQHATEAATAFRLFLKEYVVKDAYAAAAARELENLSFARQQLAKDISSYTVQKLPALGGSVTSYAPVLVKDTLLFTAAVASSNAIAKHINHVFAAVYKEGVAGEATQLAVPAAGGTHQGAAGITPDGNTLFLTQWVVNNGKKQATVYRSRRTATGWSAPEAVGKEVNVAGFNAQQPCVTGDGKYLLYASDKPGGAGGWDIWYAMLDAKGNVAAGGNAGSAINTAGDEQAPYYHLPSGTLVFASNGKTGMGGYDLFAATGKPGAFEAPENMGYPVNSIRDDIYFAVKPGTATVYENVLISSDRSSDCCLDLFYITKAAPPVVIKKEDPVLAPALAPAPLASVPVTAPVKEAEGKVIPDVYFAVNKSIPLETSYPSLDKLVAYLQENATLYIEIGGHTDSTGNAGINSQLSEARAKSVVAYLVSKGIAAERLTYKGYGASVPVAPNTKPDGSDNPEGRMQNRRTEYKVIRKK